MCMTGLNFLTINKVFPKMYGSRLRIWVLQLVIFNWGVDIAIGKGLGRGVIMQGWKAHALLYIMLYLQHILGRGLGGNHPTMGVSAVPWDLFSDRLTDKTDRWQTYRTGVKNVPIDRLCSTFLQHVKAEWFTVIKSAWQKLQHHITQQTEMGAIQWPF